MSDRPFANSSDAELAKLRDAVAHTVNRIYWEIQNIDDDDYWKPKAQRAMWGAHITITYAVLEHLVLEIAEEYDLRKGQQAKRPALKVLSNPLVDASGNPIIGSAADHAEE